MFWLTKKKLSLITAVFGSVFLAVTIFTSSAIATITLEGKYLKVNMTDDGSISAIGYNPTGSELPTTPDGDPIPWGRITMQDAGDFSMFSAMSSYPALQSYGGGLGNVYNATTTTGITGTRLSATTTTDFSTAANGSILPLKIIQNLYLDTNDKHLSFDITFKNISGPDSPISTSATLDRVSYARAWNPQFAINELLDEGVIPHYSPASTKIVTNTAITAVPFFSDSGQDIDWQAGMSIQTGTDLEEETQPEIQTTLGPWAGPADIYSSNGIFIDPLTGIVMDPDLENNPAYRDYLTAIFNIGELLAGEEKKISFKYFFDGSAYDSRTPAVTPVPEPSTSLLLLSGMLAMIFFTRRRTLAR